MPLFEYVCVQCGREFEVLVRGTEKPACPGCGSERLEKRLSAFAVNTRGFREAAPAPRPPCHGCQNQAACGME